MALPNAEMMQREMTDHMHDAHYKVECAFIRVPTQLVFNSINQIPSVFLD